MRTRYTTFLAAVTAALISWGCGGQALAKSISFKKEVLKKDLPYQIWSLHSLPDGSAPVYIANEGGKRTYLSGIKSYLVTEKGKSFVVVGENQGKKYTSILEVKVSPNSKTFAYTVQLGNRSYVVIEGEQKEGFALLDGLTFGKDEVTPAYHVDSTTVTMGAKKIKLSLRPKTKAILGPDGKTIAYATRDGSKEFVVVGDRKGKRYDYAGNPIFSPDSRTTAYVAKEFRESFIVVGDKEGKRYDWTAYPTFSPDGKKVAYAAEKDKERFIVIGEKEMKRCMHVRAPVFNPDGRTVAYAASDKLERVGFTERPGDYFVVVRGKEGKKYNNVSDPVFSPNGRSTAYVAVENKRSFVVIDGKEGDRYKLVSQPVFLDISTVRCFAYDGKNLYRITARMK